MRWMSSSATLARADSQFRGERVSKVWIFPNAPKTLLLLALVVSSLLYRGRRRNSNRNRHHRGGTATPSNLSPRRTFRISVTVSPRGLLVHILDRLTRRGTVTVLSVVAKSNDLRTTTTTLMTTSMTTSIFAIAAKRRI